MRIHVLPTPEVAAERAADWLRTEIGRACAHRGRCLIALSGGRTPWRMLRELRRLRVHWHDLQVFQVDERVVPMDAQAAQLAEHPPKTTPTCSANTAERRRHST